MDVLPNQGGSHVVHVELDDHALAVARGAVEDVVGVVVEDGQSVVALPCDVVLPGKVQRVVDVSEIVVLAAQLPDDLACLAADADHGVHVASRNNIVARVRLVDTVDVEEVKGVRFGFSVAVLHVGAAEDIGHANVVGGSPLE